MVRCRASALCQVARSTVGWELSARGLHGYHQVNTPPRPWVVCVLAWAAMLRCVLAAASLATAAFGLPTTGSASLLARATTACAHICATASPHKCWVAMPRLCVAACAGTGSALRTHERTCFNLDSAAAGWIADFASARLWGHARTHPQSAASNRRASSHGSLQCC